MNKAFDQRHLAWLERRIEETQQRIADEKDRLGKLDSEGFNTSISCRKIATMTEYLKVLNVRRTAVFIKLGILEKH